MGSAALHKQHANDRLPGANRRHHRRPRTILSLRRRDQFRAALNDAPHQRVGDFGLQQGGQFDPLTFQCRDGQERNHLVSLRLKQIQREIIPFEQIIRRLANERSRSRSRTRRAQILA